MPERYITAEILQLVLHISRASSYRLGRELSPQKIGRLNGLRVPLSAVRTQLGKEIAHAVEHEADSQLLKRRSLGLVDSAPLTEEGRATVDRLAAVWRKIRRSHGFGGRAETAETSGNVVATSGLEEPSAEAGETRGSVVATVADDEAGAE